MPFDLSTDRRFCPIEETERLCNVALGNWKDPTVRTLADRRRVALEAFQLAVATQDGDLAHLIDWPEIAEALASVMPKPKAPKAEPFAGEWCEYTTNQRKGHGRHFHAARTALFLFADDEVVLVPLGHRISKNLPDWEKAVRCALGYYRAKHGRHPPEIVDAIDEIRGTKVDAGRANEVRADWR